MDGPGSKASSFISERFMVPILAGIPVVFFLIYSRLNLGRGTRPSEM
jgi:hypothetical protein